MFYSSRLPLGKCISAVGGMLCLLLIFAGCALETKEESERRLGGGSGTNISGKANVLTAVQFYVPSEAHNEIHIIDVVSSEVVGSIPTAEAPTIVTFSSTMRQAYVANQNAGTVSFINTMTLETEREIEVGPLPHGLLLSPDNRTLYVATVGDQFIYKVNTSTGDVDLLDLGDGARSNYLAIGNNRLYVSDHVNDKVYVMNLETSTIHQTIDTGRLPRVVRLNGDNSKLFVPTAGENGASGYLEVYNTADGSKLYEVELAAGATDVVINEAENEAVVTHMEGNALSFVTLGADTGSVSAVVEGLPGAKHLAYNRIQERVYVTLSGSNEVAVLNVAARSLEFTIEVGEMPHGIAIKALPGIGGSCG